MPDRLSESIARLVARYGVDAACVIIATLAAQPPDARRVRLEITQHASGDRQVSATLPAEARRRGKA